MREEIRFVGSNTLIKFIITVAMPTFIILKLLLLNIQNNNLMDISYKNLVFIMLREHPTKNMLKVYILIIITAYSFESLNSFGLQLIIRYQSIKKWLSIKLICNALLVFVIYTVFNSVLFVFAFCVGSDMSLLSLDSLNNSFLNQVLLSIVYSEIYMMILFFIYRVARR